jgi:hypothetical protein
LKCISELNRQVREELFSAGGSEADDLRKRQRLTFKILDLVSNVQFLTVLPSRVLKDKESLVSESGRATDHLAAISRQLADTVKVIKSMILLHILSWKMNLVY